MFNRILSLIRKELIQVFRDPLTLRLTLLAPLVQLIVFAYVVNTDVENVPSALLDYDRTVASRELKEKFESSGYFQFIHIIQDEKEADELLDRGEIDMALIIPEDFQRELRTGRGAELLALFNGTDSNTATTAGNYAAGITARFAQDVLFREISAGPAEIAMSIDARPRLLFNPEAESSTYILPGIIAVLLAMLLIMLCAISIVREKEKGTMEQLSVTPIRGMELVIGKTLPFLLLGFAMIFLLTPTAIFWFSVPFRGSFLVLLLTALIYMVTCLGLGLLIGANSETQQQALMMSMFAILPQILLSGFIFPVENMPEILQLITWLIPAKYFLIIIRAIFLKGIGIEYFTFELTALVILALLIYGFSALRFRQNLGG